jgi:hypothetical protein
MDEDMLLNKIEVYRELLNQAENRSIDLTSEEVVLISQELDDLIVAYQKLK